jgi:hypothetical protein
MTPETPTKTGPEPPVFGDLDALLDSLDGPARLSDLLATLDGPARLSDLLNELDSKARLNALLATLPTEPPPMP